MNFLKCHHNQVQIIYVMLCLCAYGLESYRGVKLKDARSNAPTISLLYFSCPTGWFLGKDDVVSVVRLDLHHLHQLNSSW
jgi:hypothetical protein